VKNLTITDIAARAGVSTGAVSYALNGRPGVSEQTRARILRIADEMGWRPSAAARALKVRRAQTVGLAITRDAATLGVEPFFMKFIAGMEARLAAHRTGLLLLVAPDHGEALEAMRAWWAEKRVDGVVLTDLWAEDRRVPALERMGVPTVLVGPPREDSALPSVWSDDCTAVTAAVDHLVRLGHRRIARVAGLPALQHTRDRTHAFRDAAARHGLRRAPVVSTDYSWEQGARATHDLLCRRDRPTAVLYDSDVMALAGLSAARQLGVAVPDELSIVAGDDSQLCEMVFPALTAISRDVQAYGASVASVLLDVLDGRGASHQEPTPEVRHRESTAPPPRGSAGRSVREPGGPEARWTRGAPAPGAGPVPTRPPRTG
jgi:DNA-binding LacI/PurR family transcriptional regulator